MAKFFAIATALMFGITFSGISVVKAANQSTETAPIMMAEAKSDGDHGKAGDDHGKANDEHGKSDDHHGKAGDDHGKSKDKGKKKEHDKKTH